MLRLVAARNRTGVQFALVLGVEHAILRWPGAGAVCVINEAVGAIAILVTVCSIDNSMPPVLSEVDAHSIRHDVHPPNPPTLFCKPESFSCFQREDSG